MKHTPFKKVSMLTAEIEQSYKKVPQLSTKQITEINYKALEKKVEAIKEACSRLKNSPVSKNEALKEIKNICNSKAEEDKAWRSILGESFNE